MSKDTESSTESSNTKSEQYIPTWTPGPWYTTSGFRHIQAQVPHNHPLQDWPDCDPDAKEGPFSPCKEECEFKETMCRDEWENCSAFASVAHVPNPPGCSQADQVIGHPQVKANVDLITMAPDMASIILAWRENWDSTKGVEPDCPILRDVWAMADTIKKAGSLPF